jgi:hypothetical protein
VFDVAEHRVRAAIERGDACSAGGAALPPLDWAPRARREHAPGPRGRSGVCLLEQPDAALARGDLGARARPRALAVGPLRRLRGALPAPRSTTRSTARSTRISTTSCPTGSS